MSAEHIRFITVGFADLINNLPDSDAMASDPTLRDYWPDDEVCTWCGDPLDPITRRCVDDVWFCDDYCYTDWAADSKAESVAEQAQDPTW